VRRHGRHQLLAAKDVEARFTYRSVPLRTTDAGLGPDEEFAALQSGAGRPRVRALAERWRSESRNAAAIVDRASPCFATSLRVHLRPPPLGDDPIDAFLFETAAASASTTHELRAPDAPRRRARTHRHRYRAAN